MSDCFEPSKFIHTRSSIWRMYRDAADEDYLMARFSARSNLIYQFWWNAQQAVEKYLKAILLLNSVPVSNAGHKVLGMYKTAADLAGELLPLLHCPPRFVVRLSWPNTNPRGFYPVPRFVELLEINGNPNNRYRAFSVHTYSEYLVYLDELCFCLRRIAFPLDMQLTGSNLTARDRLLADRALQLHPKMGFDSSLQKKQEPFWNDTFKWCNFAYFPDDCLEAGEYPSWGGSINSDLFLANQSSQRGENDRKNAVFWISDRAFPKSLKKEVTDAFSKSS